MKILLSSIVCAALVSSVTGFISPSSIVPVPRSNAITSESAFGTTAPSIESGLRKGISAICAYTPKQLIQVDIVMDDMIVMSDFVYRLRNLRWIVRNHRDEVDFYRPELIVTQRGSQEADDDQFLKYDITPAAVLEFVENNRKYLLKDGETDYIYDESQTEKTEPFPIEYQIKEKYLKDDIKIVDYDDQYSSGKGSFGSKIYGGGLVYGVFVNLTKKYVTVAFRGTFGLADAPTDLNFKLDYDSFFPDKDSILVPNGKPATHSGFTTYLEKQRKDDSSDRERTERIHSCLNGLFGENGDIAGKDFKLFVTGHSLGGSLANLFAFKTARDIFNGDECVNHLPRRVYAVSFASPVPGNDDYNKEFQFLEKNGNLRYIRVANYGDVITTNSITNPVFALLIKRKMRPCEDTSLYSQTGLNFLLYPDKEMEVAYVNTKPMTFMPNPYIPSFFGPNGFALSWVDYHLIFTPKIGYYHRLVQDCNKKYLEKTFEELYDEFVDYGDLTGN